MIIGAAFTAIVNSLVNDLIMPIIGLINPKGFTGMYVGIIENGVATADTTLKNGAVIAKGEAIYRTYLYYGNFIQAVLNFVLIALVLFLMVKAINKIREKSDQLKAKAKEDAKAIREKLNSSDLETEDTKEE
jgi:large conductance mechanosensitive channel